MVQSERDRDWRLTQRARGPRYEHAGCLPYGYDVARGTFLFGSKMIKVNWGQIYRLFVERTNALFFKL